MSLDDKTLIEGCLRQNAKMQELLYKQYAPSMYSVALRYAKDSHEANDILQNGFIKVFQYLPKFRYECSFIFWIRKIIIREALKVKKLNWSKLVDIMEDFKTFDHEIYQTESMTVQEILQLMKQLPDGYRTVFQLYVLDDFSHKEIAEILGIKEATSRTQLLHARNALRKKLLNKESQYV